MSVASEITRISGAKTDIITSITNKGVTVPSGTLISGLSSFIDSIATVTSITTRAITASSGLFVVDASAHIGFKDLSHAGLGTQNYAIVINGADFSSSALGMVTWQGSNENVIGGKEYPTCTIGSQTWLAKNLDLTWDGLPIGSSQSGYYKAWYKDDDESTNGFYGNGFGLIYTPEAVQYIVNHTSTLCPGWHVPSVSELETLVEIVNGGESTSSDIDGLKKMIPATGWSVEGTNDYGYTALPVFHGSVSRTHVAQMASDDNSEYFYRLVLSDENPPIVRVRSIALSYNNQRFYSVRLIRDY